MEVNSIVALLLSHQFDAARKQWNQIRKVNKHSAIKGIGVYFNIKDKKFDEALKLVVNENDTYSVFLRSQILLNDKKPKEAFENLAASFRDEQVVNTGFTNLLLKTAASLEIKPEGLTNIISAIQKNAQKIEPAVALELSKFFESAGQTEKSVDLLKKVHQQHPKNLGV